MVVFNETLSNSKDKHLSNVTFKDVERLTYKGNSKETNA
ncbi:hypothetical protein EV196_10286 [Mariniflexile fucanivorans]|uniref:Uncharacterized protein n=1 Tax=Mariniflexile fucanivorans TaxID=264023 RepID=A0A4R1RNM5_9FLAO|nr:hypothetical protein EV196_10286 [Mariniflexile fucanivorans]